LKVGIIKGSVHGYEYIGTCGCGTVRLFNDLSWRERERITRDTVCESCGNSFWVKLQHYEHRKVFPYLEALNVSRRGFKVKRVNLSVFHDDDYNVLIKENMVQVLLFDMGSKNFKLYKNGKTIGLPKNTSPYNRRIIIENLRSFFNGVDQPKFKKMVTHPDTELLFDFVWNRLSDNGRYGAKSKFHEGLLRLAEYPHIEILANAGFPNIERFHNGSIFNRHGKNPSQILGVPKFVLKYIRENENLSTWSISDIRKALEKVDGNRFREVMEIVKDESTISEMCQALDTMIQIHDTYNYNNIKKLTLYLFREIKMNQGITSASNGATLLRDYIRMATTLGIEYEKYPKSLKKEHDIMQMNYKVQESEKKRKEFKDAVEKEEYQFYKWKRKGFSVITPSEIDDLIKEGDELSHCVASYVSSVVSGQCKILFLRDTEDVDKPLATIEVRGSNVRQARGYANRVLKKSEQEFIAEWADKKQLKLNYYY
jgi:PcfJ-like protein